MSGTGPQQIEPTIKEAHHYRALMDWIWDGSRSRLDVCESMLKHGIAPVCGWSRTAAALALITRRWPDGGRELTASLFDSYVAKGVISLDQPIEDFSSGPHDYHGRQLLHAAFMAQNEDAALALLRHGALERTDLAAMSALFRSHDRTRAGVMMDVVEANWANQPEVHARFRAILMELQISARLADETDYQVAVAPCRRMKEV